MPTRSAVYFLTLLCFIAGCDVFKKSEEREVIARAGEHKLYVDELLSSLPENLNTEDSLTFTTNYITSWATQMLLLDKAELNLLDDAKDVSAQLEEYRRSLIIYQYEKNMVNQGLDTAVSSKEIQDYYNNNKDNFELQDNIARAVFVKLAKDTKEVEKVAKWMRSTKAENREKLEEFSIQHAKSFHLNDEQWVPFGQLLGQMPKTSYLNLNYFSLYTFAHVQDSTAHYLLNVKEIKYKNSVSPLEFEEQNIRNIILNQRKLEFIQKLEKDIFDEAVSKNQFEILKN